MAKAGKKFTAARAQVQDRQYSLDEAIPLIQKLKYAKFDETVEMALRLGVDPKYADQMVRGTVVLPHGLGTTKTVLVIANADKQKDAHEAGADIVGGEELVEKIAAGWTEFDAVVATPDMMRAVGRLGKVLGPRGLMPNPKTGTVTDDTAKAVREVKAGRVEYKTDKGGNVCVPVGKVTFTPEQITDNARSVIESVLRARPNSVKGTFVLRSTLTATMSPPIRLDLKEFQA